MKKAEQLVFDEDIYNTIRRNIKKYRNEKGLTSAQLAEMVDLSHDFIRQIQSEKAGYNFSVETFYKISVALGVSLDSWLKNREIPRFLFVQEAGNFLGTMAGIRCLHACCGPMTMRQ